MEKNQALEVSNSDGKIPISQQLIQTGVSTNQMSTISKSVHKLVFSWRVWGNSGSQVQKYTRHRFLIWFPSAPQPTTQLPYVCKAFLAKPRPDDDRGALLPCDSDHGWYPSSTHDDRGHFCMRVFTDKKPFYEADHTCTAIHGGHLVSIHSG